jgi:heat shock protein HtpX
MPDADRFRAHRTENLKHTVLLVGGMVILLSALGWSLWGAPGFVMLLVIGGILALFSPQVSPQLIMRMYRGQPLGRGQAPGLVQLVHELARRADLPRPPRLYLIPSPICNAMAVGRRDDATIAVTDCLLRRMTTRELTGVLAHEISHIANNDLKVMGLADLLSRMTRLLSLMGQLLLLVNLPLLLMGRVTIPWLFIALLVVAPNLIALLQLALSRTREFDADLEAVRLTGDAGGLASALAKLERLQGGVWQRILLPDRGSPEPSLLRTHPTTEERIRRLLDIAGRPAPPAELPTGVPVVHVGQLPAARARVPRWHVSGLWY